MFQPEVVPPVPSSPADHGQPLHIDCDSCVCQHTAVCADCVVTFLCAQEPAGLPQGEPRGVVVDVSELRALRRLGEGGLVPGLRHVRRTG